MCPMNDATRLRVRLNSLEASTMNKRRSSIVVFLHKQRRVRSAKPITHATRAPAGSSTSRRTSAATRVSNRRTTPSTCGRRARRSSRWCCWAPCAAARSPDAPGGHQESHVTYNVTTCTPSDPAASWCRPRARCWQTAPCADRCRTW
jgi:hypothetical protein